MGMDCAVGIRRRVLVGLCPSLRLRSAAPIVALTGRTARVRVEHGRRSVASTGIKAVVVVTHFKFFIVLNWLICRLNSFLNAVCATSRTHSAKTLSGLHVRITCKNYAKKKSGWVFVHVTRTAVPRAAARAPPRVFDEIAGDSGGIKRLEARCDSPRNKK